MKVGDLVDDGLDNIGIVTASRNTTYCSIFVQFLNREHISGWYNKEDMEVISESR